MIHLIAHPIIPSTPIEEKPLVWSRHKKPDGLKTVEYMVTYSCRSRTDRLIGDDKACTDANLVDELGAYFFDSKLV